MPIRQKFWNSRYALMIGLEEIEVVPSGLSGVFTPLGDRIDAFHENSGDLHETREAAAARAEEMRREELARLRAEISRIEKIIF